jgi:hypothetical protein
MPPPPGDASEEDDEDRPRVRPDFDPIENPKKSGPSARGGAKPRATPVGERLTPPEAHRRQQATLTDEAALERARLESARPGDGPGESAPQSMRSSLLSMADSRPGSEPPREASGRPLPFQAQESFADLDRGWEDLAGDEPMSEEPPTRPSTPQLEPVPAATPTGPTRRGSGRLQVPPSGEQLFAPKDSAEVRVISEAENGPAEDAVKEAGFGKGGWDGSSDGATALPDEAATALRSQAAEASDAVEGTIREMRDRFSLGDYTGALVLAEGLLEDALDDPEVRECAEACRQVLRQMYTARIGPLDRVPVVTVARDQLRWLSIDHRAGFVLSHIDGVSSLEQILDVSGMPLLDALRILCELAQQRIISFR